MEATQALFPFMAVLPRCDLQGPSGFRIVHEFSNLLSAPAGDRDLRGPCKRFIARAHLDDREPADHSFGLWRRRIGNHAIGAKDARSLLLKAAAMDPDASAFRFPNHRVRCRADSGPFVIRNLGHCAVIKRDQVPGHSMAPFQTPIGKLSLGGGAVSARLQRPADE